MKQIEITSPCCLDLGWVWHEGKLGYVQLALKHPTLSLSMKLSDEMLISGPRANIARDTADFLISYSTLSTQVEIIIEDAVPAFMGLSSDDTIKESVELGLRRLLKDQFREYRTKSGSNNIIQRDVLRHGGLSITGDQHKMSKHLYIPEHQQEIDDWVFVLVLPKLPEDFDDSQYEAVFSEILFDTYRLAGEDTLENSSSLLAAIENDDLPFFAKSLERIHKANEDAMARDSDPIAERIHPSEANEILKIMRDNGVLTCAQTPTGLGLYALVQGREASRTLRDAFKQHYGYFGPLVTATICDNAGVKMKVIGK
jgi:predicted sugar kinase